MKIKFVIALVLAVICLLPVVTGVSTAQQDDLNRASLDYKACLPIVSNPPCTWVQPTAYVAVNQPIVKVDDWVTITGALFNECHYVGEPSGRIETFPEDLLYPSNAMNWHIANFLSDGVYATYIVTLQAVQPGAVSIVALSVYEVHYPNGTAWWESSRSDPAVIRIVP